MVVPRIPIRRNGKVVAVFAQAIPPLRERPEDIPVLIRHFIDQLPREAGMIEIGVEPAAMSALETYPWPGNVRELLNVVERLLARLDGRDTICLDDLPFYLKPDDPISSKPPSPSIREVSHRAERDAIRFALKAANNNKAEAARRLGIHRTQLYKKMKKYDLPL